MIEVVFYFYAPQNYNRRYSRYRLKVRRAGLRAAQSTYRWRSFNETKLVKVVIHPGQSTLSSQHEMLNAVVVRRTYRLRHYFQAFASDESALVSGDPLRSTGALMLLRESFVIGGPILKFA